MSEIVSRSSATHEVQTLVASAPASAGTKALALDRLKALDARGNTDLCGGWMRGAEEVGAVLQTYAGAGTRSDALSRVLLLSDGLANPRFLSEELMEDTWCCRAVEPWRNAATDPDGKDHSGYGWAMDVSFAKA